MPKILHYIIYIMNHDDILTYEKLVAAVLFWYLLLYRGIAWWLHYEDRGIKNKYLSIYFIENIQKYKP